MRNDRYLLLEDSALGYLGRTNVYVSESDSDNTPVRNISQQVADIPSPHIELSQQLQNLDGRSPSFWDLNDVIERCCVYLQVVCTRSQSLCCFKPTRASIWIETVAPEVIIRDILQCLDKSTALSWQLCQFGDPNRQHRFLVEGFLHCMMEIF